MAYNKRFCCVMVMGILFCQLNVNATRKKSISYQEIENQLRHVVSIAQQNKQASNVAADYAQPTAPAMCANISGIWTGNTVDEQEACPKRSTGYFQPTPSKRFFDVLAPPNRVRAMNHRNHPATTRKIAVAILPTKVDFADWSNKQEKVDVLPKKNMFIYHCHVKQPSNSKDLGMRSMFGYHSLPKQPRMEQVACHICLCPR